MAPKQWFTSDLHLGHENIFIFEPSRQKLGNTIQEHDTALISRILSVVNKGDILYILGDVGLAHPAYIKVLLKSLINRGIVVILVRGNHDKNSVGQMLGWGLASVCESLTLKICKKEVLLSHYPYRWNWFKHKLFGKRNDNHKRPKDRGLWLLHGHSHSEKTPIKKRQINVGVDNWDYYPVSLQEIEKIIQRG